MPFETAEDLAVFFDPEEFGASAVYRPAAGGAIPLTVIHDQPTGEASFGPARIVVDTNMLQIQRTDVTRPAAGDIVSLLDPPIELELLGEPRLDRTGVRWICEARELLA